MKRNHSFDKSDATETSRLREYLSSISPDSVMDSHLRSDIDKLSRTSSEVIGKCSTDCVWRPLLVGYGGSGNTGAEVRLIEIVRLLYDTFPGIEPTVAISAPVPELDQFEGLHTLIVDQYFPDFLATHVPEHNGIVVYEGSVFTSTFSDDLSLKCIAALAMGNALGIPTIAFGVQVDESSERLRKFYPYLKDSLVICRSEGSMQRTRGFGFRSKPGADPAWSYSVDLRREALRWLSASGITGDRKILAIAPVDPFRWPVRADTLKAVSLPLDPSLKPAHFGGVYFHDMDERYQRRYSAYIRTLAESIADICDKQDYFPVLIPMERVDLQVCRDVAAEFTTPGLLQPATAENMSIPMKVAILQQSDLVVSARFHGCLLSLSGSIPTIGLAFDSRVSDLFAQMDLAEYWLEANAESIANQLIPMVEEALRQGNSLEHRITRAVEIQRKTVDQMKSAIAEEVRQYYPGIVTDFS